MKFSEIGNKPKPNLTEKDKLAKFIDAMRYDILARTTACRDIMMIGSNRFDLATEDGDYDYIVPDGSESLDYIAEKFYELDIEYSVGKTPEYLVGGPDETGTIGVIYAMNKRINIIVKDQESFERCRTVFASITEDFFKKNLWKSNPDKPITSEQVRERLAFLMKFVACRNSNF